MPKRRLVGPLPRINTRRLSLFLVCLASAAIVITVALSAIVPRSPRLSDYGRKTTTNPASSTTTSRISETLSKSPLNPFKQASHPPPRQKNDEYGGSSWWVDWTWLSVPFSKSLTADDRALLPPLKERSPIYCYYDATVSKTREEKDAESDLLLTWRRAWWAQGFRPIILSAAEAMENPHHGQVQNLEMDDGLRADLMRWLAWDTMGGGLLAEHTMFPMGPKDDPILSHLRRGQYPELTSWKGLRSGLLAGPGPVVTAAVGATLGSPKLAEAKTVLAALQDDHVHTDDRPSSLAYYSRQVVDKKYGAVAEAAGQSAAKGLQALNKLINAHLHVAWQNTFSRGIEVLKPHPNHTTKMVSDAMGLAESLLACSETPMPGSCPPNRPKCTPCASGSKGMKIATVPYYRNSSSAFAIGVVPHPWTLATLDLLRDTFDIADLRLESRRDPWLTEVTGELLDSGASGDVRVMCLKEAVASEYAEARVLWLTAEDPLPMDLEWHFGFTIPKHLRQAVEKPLDWDDPSEDPALEWILLERAKQVIAQVRSTEDTKIRASLEEWNPADTEAWKFARAFQARRAMERDQWEKEEAKYSQGSGTEGGRSAWSRWQDAKDDNG